MICACCVATAFTWSGNRDARSGIQLTLSQISMSLRGGLRIIRPPDAKSAQAPIAFQPLSASKSQENCEGAQDHEERQKFVESPWRAQHGQLHHLSKPSPVSAKAPNFFHQTCRSQYGSQDHKNHVGNAEHLAGAAQVAALCGATLPNTSAEVALS